MFPANVIPRPLARLISDIWAKHYPDHKSIILLFEDVSSFMVHLEHEIKRTSGKIWTDSAFSGILTNPLIDRLLRIRSGVDNEKPGTVVLEACRLALMLSLAGPRRWFGQDPVMTTVQVGKLRDLLSNNSHKWPGLEELRLWVIMMGAMEAQEPIQLGWFECELTRISWEQGITTYDEAEKIMQRIVWVASVHRSKLRNLKAYSSVTVEQ